MARSKQTSLKREKEKTSASINVFKLNVKYFPGSWNCYDSLGKC